MLAAIVGDIAPSDNVTKEVKNQLEAEAMQKIRNMLGHDSAAGIPHQTTDGSSGLQQLLAHTPFQSVNACDCQSWDLALVTRENKMQILDLVTVSTVWLLLQSFVQHNASFLLTGFF